jgi:transposase
VSSLAARVRVLSVGHGRKSDPDDAVSVAVAARNAPWLRQVAVEDRATVLHLLTKRREDLVAARTQTINRLHRLLVDLVPGGARRNLTAKRAAVLLAGVTPAVGRGLPVPGRRPAPGRRCRLIRVGTRRRAAQPGGPTGALRPVVAGDAHVPSRKVDDSQSVKVS